MLILKLLVLTKEIHLLSKLESMTMCHHLNFSWQNQQKLVIIKMNHPFVTQFQGSLSQPKDLFSSHPEQLCLSFLMISGKKKKKQQSLIFLTLRAECIFACCMSRCFCLKSFLLLMRKVDKQLQLIEQSKLPITANNKHLKVMGCKRTTGSEKERKGAPKLDFYCSRSCSIFKA